MRRVGGRLLPSHNALQGPEGLDWTNTKRKERGKGGGSSPAPGARGHARATWEVVARRRSVENTLGLPAVTM